MNPLVGSEPVSGVVKALPWDLSDLTAYLLIGAMIDFVGLVASYGVQPIQGAIEQHPFLAGVGSIVFGYPTGIVTLGVGRLLREVLVKLNAPRNPRDEYAEGIGRTVGPVITKAIWKTGAPVDLPAPTVVRVGVILAGKHLPAAAAALNRQNAMYRFFVTLLGGALLSLLLLEGGALLRLGRCGPGPAAPYALWGLVPLAILFLAEYWARYTNSNITQMMAETALAVAVVLSEEKGK